MTMNISQQPHSIKIPVVTLRNSQGMNSFLLTLLLVTCAIITAYWMSSPQQYGLRGRYYLNQQWEGDPVNTFIDADLAAAVENLQYQTVSVTWTGYLVVPETGVYRFSTNSDDGSRLYIEENLVVDNGGVHGLEQQEGEIHLLKGLHTLKVRYLQTGGFAALRVKWGKESESLQPLRGTSLLPPAINTAGFWIFRTSRHILPFFGYAWGLVVLWLAISTYRILRRSQRTLSSSVSLLRVWPARTLSRLVTHPVIFAGQQIIRPQVYYWILVVVYSCVIFLTLSYARTISDVMMTRYGDDIFSRITHVSLIVAGAGILAYFLTRRTHLVSRLVFFLLIAGVYGFLLNAELRDAIYDLLQTLGVYTETLESLDIYPLYAGEKVHFLEYGLLGLLLCKALSTQMTNNMAYLLALLFVYLIGMSDEFIQWALPSRVGEFRDIWMNVMSGGLAILAVLLVIRPKAFRHAFARSSLRPIGYTAAIAVIYTGLFLQTVHGFGSKIFMPDTGAEFVSGFSEYELLQFDQRLLRRFEGKPAHDDTKNDLWIINYEFNRHHHLRNQYYKKQQFFQSYCEQEILKTYFRSFLRQGRATLYEYDVDEFRVTPDPTTHIFYESEGQELSLTAFEPETMWEVIAILASFLCGVAVFSSPGVTSCQQFERRVGRPLVVGALLIAVCVPLYWKYVPQQIEHTNVVIVTLESSQPDYLSAYGYPKKTTPFFDELASEGVVFSNMITATSWTIPSLASLFTGVSPNVHGINARGDLMDQAVPTLFEALEQHGYAVGDTSYTLTEPSMKSVYKKDEISPQAALSEGRSEESYLLSWMHEHQNDPFMAWVHLHTTHLPYRASPPYNQMFMEDIDRRVLDDEQIKLVLSQLIIRKGEVAFDLERHPEVVRALFTQTLRQQDAKLGKILMKLEELGLRDNTLVIVTADHGDELLEHGFIGHASTSWDTTVYDDLINIPLVLTSPRKLPQGEQIENQVRLIDLMPTVLDILDIPFSQEIQGKSFYPLIQGKKDFQEYAFSETTPCGYSCPKRLEKNRLRAIRTNDWKLIEGYHHKDDQTTYELYSLADDPAETRDVIEQHPEIAEQLKQEMQRWKDAPQSFGYSRKKSDKPHYLDADVENRPIVLYPKVGTVITPKTHDQKVVVRWIGHEDQEYLIEYDVGTGGYHVEGEIEVTGTEHWFGPYPEDIWQALPLYNPWKFRIVPKNYPQYPSEWMTFEMRFE